MACSTIHIHSEVFGIMTELPLTGNDSFRLTDRDSRTSKDFKMSRQRMQTTKSASPVLLFSFTWLPDFLLLPVVRNSCKMFTKRTSPQQVVTYVLPWTPLCSPYSCAESHCWLGHHSSWCFKARGRLPVHQSCVLRVGVREGYYILWRQRAVVNSPKTIHSVSGKGPKGSGVAELRQTRGKVLGRWHLPVWFLPGYCSP